MTTLPTPEQLVINGLKYFLRMNERVEVGQLLAPLYHPGGTHRESSGICFYVKVNIWWHELPEHYKDGEQRALSLQAENLIDKLIKPYLAPGQSYLPQKGILTAERLKVVSQLLSKLQEQQNETTN